jgi:ionotropic glutamate receptor NMDA 3A
MHVLVSGSAHMSFAPISVTSVRATAVDFSTPFFFSGVGFLGMSKNQDVPLMAFLAPFSFELWAAIFLT